MCDLGAYTRRAVDNYGHLGRVLVLQDRKAEALDALARAADVAAACGDPGDALNARRAHVDLADELGVEEKTTSCLRFLEDVEAGRAPAPAKHATNKTPSDDASYDDDFLALEDVEEAPVPEDAPRGPRPIRTADLDDSDDGGATPREAAAPAPAPAAAEAPAVATPRANGPKEHWSSASKAKTTKTQQIREEKRKAEREAQARTQAAGKKVDVAGGGKDYGEYFVVRDPEGQVKRPWTSAYASHESRHRRHLKRFDMPPWIAASRDCPIAPEPPVHDVPKDGRAATDFIVDEGKRRGARRAAARTAAGVERALAKDADLDALFAAFPETRDLRDLARLLLFELGKLGKDLDDRTRGADRANHVLPDLWRFIEILETLEFGDRTCRALAEQRDGADAALRGAYGPAVRAQCASLDRQLGKILAHLHELAAIDANGNDDTDVDVGRPAFNHGEWERRFNGGRRSGVTVDRSAKFQHGAWLALSATRSRREDRFDGEIRNFSRTFRRISRAESSLASHLEATLGVAGAKGGVSLVLAKRADAGKENERDPKRAGGAAVTGTLDCLAAYGDLVEVNLDRPLQLTGSLDALSKLAHLCTLCLKDAKSLAGTLAPLEELKHLITLNLSGCSHVAGDFASLRKLDQLRTLDLEGTAVGGDVARLKGCEQLSTLHLYDCGHVTGSFDDLPHAKLVSLRLRGKRRPSGLVGSLHKANRMLNLKHLVLQNAHLLTGTLKSMKVLRLITLDLHGCRGLEGDLEPLCESPKLQLLDLSGSGMHHNQFAGGLHHLRNVASLTRVNLNHCPNLTGGLACLRKLEKVDRLTIRGCVQLAVEKDGPWKFHCSAEAGLHIHKHRRSHPGDWLMHEKLHDRLMRKSVAEIKRQRKANSGPWRYRRPYSDKRTKTGSLVPEKNV